METAGRQRVRWSETLSHDATGSSSSGGSQPAHKNSQPPMPVLQEGRLRRTSSHVHSHSKPAEQQTMMISSGGDRSFDTTLTTDTSSVLSKFSVSTSDTNASSEAWRKHGKLYRARLLMADEEQGGNTFVLSRKCRIVKYYDVAEKVLDQFLKTSVDESKDLNESYLVGNRLVKFLSTVLPTHPDYFSSEPNLMEKRNKSQAQLVQLLQYLDRVALIIDEYELNKYILNDLKRKPTEGPSHKKPMVDLSSTASTVDAEDNVVVVDPPNSSSEWEGTSSSFEQDKEFNQARDWHLRRKQDDDSNSWDSSFSQYASRHPSPRVVKSQTKRLQQAFESSKHRARSRSPSSTNATSRDMSLSTGGAWEASFPVNFPGSTGVRTTSGGSPRRQILSSTRPYSTRGSQRDFASVSSKSCMHFGPKLQRKSMSDSRTASMPMSSTATPPYSTREAYDGSVSKSCMTWGSKTQRTTSMRRSSKPEATTALSSPQHVTREHSGSRKGPDESRSTISRTSYSTRGSSDASVYRTWLDGGPQPVQQRNSMHRSSSSSNRREEAGATSPSPTREQSPKSTTDFPKWSPAHADEPISLEAHSFKGYVGLDIEPPPPEGSEEGSTLTAEDEELSLTSGRPRRRQILSVQQFKGCVKCLLE